MFLRCKNSFSHRLDRFPTGILCGERPLRRGCMGVHMPTVRDASRGSEVDGPFGSMDYTARDASPACPKTQSLNSWTTGLRLEDGVVTSRYRAGAVTHRLCRPRFTGQIGHTKIKPLTPVRNVVAPETEIESQGARSTNPDCKRCGSPQEPEPIPKWSGSGGRRAVVHCSRQGFIERCQTSGLT